MRISQVTAKEEEISPCLLKYLLLRFHVMTANRDTTLTREASCQPYHICADDGFGGMEKFSFLCPNGTLFSPVSLVCDWWFNVECEGSNRVSKAKVIEKPQPKKNTEKNKSQGGRKIGRKISLRNKNDNINFNPAVSKGVVFSEPKHFSKYFEHKFGGDLGRLAKSLDLDSKLDFFSPDYSGLAGSGFDSQNEEATGLFSVFKKLKF